MEAHSTFHQELKLVWYFCHLIFTLMMLLLLPVKIPAVSSEEKVSNEKCSVDVRIVETIRLYNTQEIILILDKISWTALILH